MRRFTVQSGTLHHAVAFVLIAVSSRSSKASTLWASGGGTLSLSPINSATGTVGQGVPINGLTHALSDLAADGAKGSLVWGIDGFVAAGPLIAIDPVTKQTVSSVAISGAQSIQSLAIDPVTGEFYGATTSGLYRIAPTTGIATLVGATALSVEKALGFDANGKLYGITNHDRLVSVDKATGATSLVAVLAVAEMEDIAAEPETGVMYGIGYGPSYNLYQIDLANGSLATVGPSLLRPMGLAFATVPEPSWFAMFVAMNTAFVNARRRPTSHNRV